MDCISIILRSNTQAFIHYTYNYYHRIIVYSHEHPKMSVLTMHRIVQSLDTEMSLKCQRRHKGIYICLEAERYLHLEPFLQSRLYRVVLCFLTYEKVSTGTTSFLFGSCFIFFISNKNIYFRKNND